MELQQCDYVTVLGLEKYNTIYFVAHSAGGANLVLSLMQRLKDQKICKYNFSGPAYDLFQLKNLDNKFESFDYKIVDPDRNSSVLITGTSGRPSLERKAIEKFKKMGIKTISILDHWGNFALRFIPYEKWSETVKLDTFLPDTIIVVDKKAHEQALKENIPAHKLIEIKNPYILDIKEEYKIKSKKIEREDGVILYVSEYFLLSDENLSHDNNEDKFSEHDFVNYIMDNLHKEKNKIKTVIFRLHPSEKVEKYKYLEDKYPEIEFSYGRELVDDLLRTKIVIGRTSMALYIAAELGIETYAIGHEKLPALPDREGIKKIIDYGDFKNILMRHTNLKNA